jgi:hypothetical protein
MDKLTKSVFQSLQSALTDYSLDGTKNKLELLKQCSLEKKISIKQIESYHNSLLFLLSYAESESVYALAESEMQRITNLIKDKKNFCEQLVGSGIAGTETQGAYSYTLVKWMIKIFPHTLSIHSFDEEGVHPKEILKHTLSEAEFELTSDEKLNAIKWLEKASGTKNKKEILVWLINQMELINASKLIKDQLFESLKLYVEIEPNNNSFSRSYGKVQITKQYFHAEGLLKKFNELELINKKLPVEKKLNLKEKQQIIEVSRIALCLLNRETDPITYCEELNLKYYELERGLSIALFSIDAERRLPIESYVGFMMFKNGYPMSYGGAWLFGSRSLIGINIFESFRGGESAVVFAQLLRCYKMAFGASYFEVEPYQFGKNNPEGIQSGAFWFYYRFGFKPCDKELFKLALNEHQKIVSTKGYRTSVEILKTFTKSNLFVCFNNSSEIPLNPSDLSKYVSNKIATEFNGDRRRAYKWSIQKLKEQKINCSVKHKIGLTKLALFFAFCLNWKKISAKEKALLQKLILTKGTSEFEYISLVNQISFKKNIDVQLTANT